MISPGGFENYFRELSEAFREAGTAGPDPGRMIEICERYGLEMDLGSVADLCARFGLTHPML